MESVRVAIIGFGTIGSGIADVLEKQGKLLTARTGKNYEIAYILDVRDFSLHPLSDKFVTSIDRITEDASVSVVAEAIGGVNPAYDFVMKCLRAKKHVVTSNKELVATKGVEMLAEAKRNGVGFLFEAAVGGTTPLIGTMLGALAANRIERIDGILNGTTNYMLTGMAEKKMSFDAALEAAQRRGYAETIDPSADIDGIDAQRKIAILASLAYGRKQPVGTVRTEGIRHVTEEDIRLAGEAGGIIKLVASASGSEFGAVSAAVRPMFVQKESRFASVSGVYNMIRMRCDLAGDIEVYGRGAGKLPTAGVVVGDIVELTTKQIGRPVFYEEGEVTEPQETEKTAYFAVVSAKGGAVPDRLADKVDPAARTEGAIGFFTGDIAHPEREALRQSLTKRGVTLKFYEILKD